MEYKQKNDISTSIEGMRKWAELMAETLGVTPDDITRTSGCELEFLVISENKAAFRKRLTELKKDGYRGYVKESEYMPKALRPTKWQAKLEKAKISQIGRAHV